MGARKKYVLSVCHKGRMGKSPSESKWQPVQQFACHQQSTCDEHAPSYYSAHVGGWKTWHASGKIRVSTDMPVQVSVYTVRAPAILAVGKNVWQVTWLAIWHWILLFGRNLNVPGPYLGHTRLSGISTFDKYVLAWIWCRVTHRLWLPWKRRWTPHLCSLGSQWTWRWVQWAQHPCQPATNGAAPRNHLQLRVKDDISGGRGLSTCAPQKWLRKGLIWKQHYTQVNLPTHLAHCFSPVCSKVAGWITACYGLHEIMTLVVLWPYETGHLKTMAEHPCQAAHAAHIDGSNLRILLWHARPETKW